MLPTVTWCTAFEIIYMSVQQGRRVANPHLLRGLRVPLEASVEQDLQVPHCRRSRQSPLSEQGAGVQQDVWHLKVDLLRAPAQNAARLSLSSDFTGEFAETELRVCGSLSSQQKNSLITPALPQHNPNITPNNPK